MKDWRLELNDSQYKAANQIDGPLLILAGAGSGKTKTMTHRICHMLEEGIPASSILAITFTNKAADEMKERVEKMINDGEESSLPVPLVCTFHSLGYRMLKRFGSFMGYKGKVTICDEDDRKKRIQDIIKESGFLDNSDNEDDDDDSKKLKAIYDEVSKLISKFKDELVYANKVDEFLPEADEVYPYLTIAKQVYRKYEEQLFQDNSVDLDDLIEKPVFLLERYPEVLEYYNEKFEYISVDEYQDTSKAQARLVFLLTGEKHNVCVVGDDYQSIYAFRGAIVDNILNFSQQFNDCKTIILEENYRSTKNIVDGAAGVIAYNTKQMHKTLRSMNDEGSLIQVREYKKDKQEASAIATKIKKAHDSGLKYSDIAILYRSNAMSRIYEDALIKESIPYKIFGGVSFYDRREIKDIVSYLKMASGSDDTMVLKRIANVPKRKLGDKSVTLMLSAVREMENKSLLERLTNYADSVSKFKELSGLLNGFYEDAKTMSLSALLLHIIETIKYEDYLKGISKDPDDFIDRRENLYEIVNKASEFETSYVRDESVMTAEELSSDITPMEILEAFLEDIALMSDKVKDKNAEAVNLMTMHKSKGLEFHTVFVAGCETPSNGIPKEEIEEARRLFYVSMTRAKKKLYVTYAGNRFMFGNESFREPLPFVREIPEENKNFKRIKENKKDLPRKSSYYSGIQYYNKRPPVEKPWWLE